MNSMKDNSRFPRVLIINHSRINEFDAHGVSIRTWFADWPKNNLAQIYSGGESGEKVFCKYNFKLGQNERRFGKFFFKIKRSSLGKSSYATTLTDTNKSLNKISIFSLVKYKTSKFLINTGLWEFIFKPKLSQDLNQFIEDFQPQVIYCQGYNLTFTWLPIMVYKKFKIPICFQTGDDWPTYLYKKSPIYFAIKPIIKRSVLALLSISNARLANGRLMAEEYFKRYQLSFEPVMMCDDIQRFRNSNPRRVTDSDVYSVIYTGGLANNRWKSLVDLSKAVKVIPKRTLITAFASVVPKEAVNALNQLDNLQICGALSHEEVPSYLKGADILFLPETFDAENAEAIRLSISTKAHLYMMSERPVLIYASPITGIVNYAKTQGWAHIIDEEDKNKLSNGVDKLLNDAEYCNQLINTGLEVVEKNHDQNIVRNRLLEILQKICIQN